MPIESTPSSGNGPTGARPSLAILCNTLPPYRTSLHLLLAREIPELRLLTLVTHGDADFRWQQRLPDEIHVTHFARRKESASGGMLVAPWTDWKKGADLIRFCEEQQVVAVILSSYGYPSHLRLMRRLAQRGVPFFLHNDSNIRLEFRLTRKRRWIKRLFFRWAKRHASGCMPMGSYGEAYYAEYGMPREKMYRVPCTPDYDLFARRDEARVEAFRQKFGLDPRRRRILFSGRLHPVKRVDLLIDAFSQIADQRPEWDLVILGAGPLEQMLRDRVPKALESRVIWTGFMEMDEVRDAYHACDALALPSEIEAWSVVVQEAMAAGIPVISSDIVGAAHDLVEDRVSGCIFKSCDLQGLTDALLDVTDPHKLAKYKEAAVARLAAWRREVDVVQNVRRALRDAGALTS